MLRRAALLLCLSAAPAVALTAAQKEAVMQQWQQAQAEHQVFFTCAALNNDQEKGIRKEWEAMRAKALTAMAKAGWPEADRATLETGSTPEALRLPDTTPFGEVFAYCQGFIDWPAVVASGSYTRLDEEVTRILGSTP